MVRGGACRWRAKYASAANSKGSRVPDLPVVTIAEQVLRLLPPGTHQPEGSIRPNELTKLLRRQGFTVGPMTGLGPRGLNHKLDITFGRVPSNAILYLGHARLARSI